MVPAAVEACLACGHLDGGFARIRCPSCRVEHLLAFSCRTRNFCPSCRAKRAAAFAEKLVTGILEPVPHRHVVLTIPRVLRGLSRRKRRLLSLLGRATRDGIVQSFRAILDRKDVAPRLVVSIQTSGAYAANFHPHLHAWTTDGAFTPEGEFLELPPFDRRGSSRRSSAAGCSADCTGPGGCPRSFLRSLLGWLRSGFSAHGNQAVPAADIGAAERLARYLTRGGLALDAVERTEGEKLRVRDTARSAHRPSGQDGRSPGPHPRDHGPDPRPRPAPGPLLRLGLQPYAGWTGGKGLRNGKAAPPPEPAATLPAGQASRARWPRLLRRIFDVDLPLCARLRFEMKVVSAIADPAVVDRILTAPERLREG